MAGDVRGHDLDSWWRNRATYRADVSAAVGQWRTEAQRLTLVSGGARPVALASPPEETIDALRRAGTSVLSTLNTAKGQLDGLEAERWQAQTDFATEQSAIESGCRQRVQAERAQAHQSAQKSAVRVEKSKVVVRKFIAAAIFISVLYVIVRF